MKKVVKAMTGEVVTKVQASNNVTEFINNEGDLVAFVRADEKELIIVS